MIKPLYLIITASAVLINPLTTAAEEEQKIPKKQPQLTPVIRAMFASPGNRDVRVHDGFPTWFFGTKKPGCKVQDSRQPCMGSK